MNIPTLAATLGIERQRLYDIQSGKTKKLSFELATIISKTFEDVNFDWLTGKEAAPVRSSYSQQEGNPYFANFTVQGGYAHGDGQEKALVPDGYMTVPGINADPDIPFIMARGHSMVNREDPTHSITPGSWVAVKRVVGGAIRWGEVYAMETVDGPIIKKLMPSEKDNYVKCVSFNEDYPPFDLPVSDIVEGALYLVKGVVNVQIWN